MDDCHHLADHPPHRNTEDVTPGDPQMVEETDGVGGEVAEVVGRCERSSVGDRCQDLGDADLGLAHLLRMSHVPVVERDQVVPGFGELPK